MNDRERFVATMQRRIPGLPSMKWVDGKRILVTGGTGCIGSKLMAELHRHHPAQLVSVSLDPPGLWPETDSAEYRKADIRNRDQLRKAFAGEWDIVFHTAAQRDPGLAEKDIWQTVTTNVFGSRNVLETVEEMGVPRIVCASTGKAFRPFSREAYTATKRIAEWLLACSSVPARACVRFTHVIDNSLFYDKLLAWCEADEDIELHSAEIMFYIQSAIEAAELLMGAAATSTADVPQCHAITDLDMPVSLYDLAEQTRVLWNSKSKIVITGYEAGYEAVPFPGLYHPELSDGVSPLINAFEAARSWQPYPGVDAFPLEFGIIGPCLKALERACCTRDPDLIRSEMNEVSWDLMRCTIDAVPPAIAGRVAQHCKQYEPLCSPHDKMLDIINETAGSGRKTWDRSPTKA